jgi:hypothetical protein
MEISRSAFHFRRITACSGLGCTLTKSVRVEFTSSSGFLTLWRRRIQQGNERLCVTNERVMQTSYKQLHLHRAEPSPSRRDDETKMYGSTIFVNCQRNCIVAAANKCTRVPELTDVNQERVPSNRANLSKTTVVSMGASYVSFL